MTNTTKIVLGLGAHPDDAEFLFAGTLALLQKKGWDVHIATMTPGDCGTKEYTREEISAIRKKEAATAAKLLGADYNCLESPDAFIMYDQPTLRKVTGLMRKIRPSVVLSLSPEDYMMDHIMTSKLAMSGCFFTGIPNIAIENVTDYEPIPYLYYADPMEGKDIYGRPVEPGFIVDISDVIETKKQMLMCHASQRDWLLKHHGSDDYINSMTGWGAVRGKQISRPFGEGFRQHLGHAFPQDNILQKELGDAIHIL